MNNGDPWWYRTLASASVNVFWALWGGVIGAFLTVVLGAVNAGGELVKAYLAVATAIGGGLLGIYGSRAMDRQSDERRQRRKASFIRLQVRGLIAAFIALRDRIDNITNNGQRMISPPGQSQGAQFTTAEAMSILVGTQAVFRASTHKFDLDDFLDSPQDFDHVDAVLGTFSFAEHWYGDMKFDTSDLTKHLASLYGSRGARRHSSRYRKTSPRTNLL